MVSSSRVSLSRWRAMYLAIRAIVYGVMLSAFFGNSSVAGDHTVNMNDRPHVTTVTIRFVKSHLPGC